MMLLVLFSAAAEIKEDVERKALVADTGASERLACDWNGGEMLCLMTRFDAGQKARLAVTKAPKRVPARILMLSTWFLISETTLTA
jgi:hypothetical protein